MGLVIGFEHVAMGLVGAPVWWGLALPITALEPKRDAALPPNATPRAKLFIEIRDTVAEVIKRGEREQGFTLGYRFDAGDPDKPALGTVTTDTARSLASPPGTRFGGIYDPALPGHHHRLAHDLG